MRKKIVLILFCGVLLLNITGCKSSKKESTNNKIANYEWTDLDTKKINYDWTDANKEEITNIFNHVGFWHTNNENNEVLWGVSIQNLYEEMKKIESSNKFAQNFISKADNIRLNELNKLELDFLDTYIKILFKNLNDKNELPINNSDLPTVKDLGKVTKVYIDNYNDNYETQKTEYYRVIYCYFEKEEIWAYSHSADEKDDKFTQFTENVEYKENSSTKAIDSSIINNIIKKNISFINFLISYRDEVYTIEIEKSLKKQGSAEEKIDYEPAIGMSKEDVKNSTWGSPDKINRDTYASVVKEQWVYNKHGYIYFENGVVTTISER